jgi:HEAT repeat protein
MNMIYRLVAFVAIVMWIAPPVRCIEIDPATDAYTKAYGLVLDQKWVDARKEFEGLIKSFPKSKWIEGSRYWLCHIREKLGEPPDSVYSCYAKFIEQYPKSPWAEQAASNLVLIGAIKRMRRGGDGSVPFVPMRTNKDEDAQLASIFAMQDQDSSAAFQAASSLYDTSRNEVFRAKVIYVLGSFHTSRAASKLAGIVRNDPSPRIRSDALSLLVNIRSPESVAFLLELLRTGESADSRVRALSALLQMRVPGMDTISIRLALSDQREDVASTAVRALVRMDEKIDSEVFQRLFREGKYTHVRQSAFFVLAGLSRQAIPLGTMEEIARTDPDPIIRLCAIQLMQKSGNKLQIALAVVEVFNAFARWGESGEPMLEILAGDLDGKEFREMFVYCAVSDPSLRLASAALYGLERLPGKLDPKDYAAIVQYSPHPEVRKRALQLIAQTAAAVPVNVLTAALRKKDSDAGVRLAAIQALASSGNDSAVVVLQEVAKEDQVTQVRGSAIIALEKMNTSAAQKALQELREE